MEKQIYDYVVKGSEKAIKIMEDILNTDGFDTKDCNKYFHTWVIEGLGRFMFPREKYFVSHDNETNYIIALMKYGSREDVRPCDLVYPY